MIQCPNSRVPVRRFLWRFLHLDRDLWNPARETRFAFGTNGLHHRCGEVDAHISGLVGGEKDRLGVIDAAFWDLFPVYVKGARAALANAIAVIGELETALALRDIDGDRLGGLKDDLLTYLVGAHVHVRAHREGLG